MPNPVAGGTIERTDQGVDVSGAPGAAVTDPVPGLSQAVGVIRNWYRGQPLEWFRVVSGALKGRYWYGAEQISFSVQPGQQVAQGQRIGSIAPSGTGTEFGWATASGQTLAQATTGYTEGQATPAGQDFRSRIISGAGGAGWAPCLLTWYDPALGGINTTGGADPHARTASGEPYNAGADTCAAPPAYPFGTVITFQYQGKTVTCKVNDRGGAIQGNHFDLSRHAAETLGIVGAGAVRAQFIVGGGGPPAAAADPNAGVDDLFTKYEDEVNAPRTAPATAGTSKLASLRGKGGTSPFQWWWQSFSGRWE